MWVEEGSDGGLNDLETVEAEVVFLIRQEYGQWPEHQTEIHFHRSSAEHRKLARMVVAYYAQLPTDSFKLPTFGGGQLQPGVNLDSSAALLDLMDAPEGISNAHEP